MKKITPTEILMGIFLLLTLSCSASPSKPNQQQGVVSPNGKFILQLPIELQTTDPTYKGTPVWKLTIKDPSGVVLYKDESSIMVGTLNIYWGWDAENRVWLYNSDDGRIWRWEENPDGWKKIASKREDGMPEWILPDYARKR